MTFPRLNLVLLVFAFLTIGCRRNAAPGRAGDSSVTLYTSVDEPYVRPLIAAFQKETGIAVTLITDGEASKTVGLAERVRAEKDHPKADVWWDNECFQTLRLADEKLLAPYDSPSAADIPTPYKDLAHVWAGSTLRVRVLVSSPCAAGVKNLTDLLRPEFKNRVVIARPTAGTTGGHVAALYALWGDQKADAFFHDLRANGVAAVGGNSLAAEAVARGEMSVGLCDNDDAASAAAEIGKLDTVLPDQAEGGIGTLAMPCAVSLVAGAPHEAAGKRLIDYLLRKETDRALIDAKFAWASTRDAATLQKTRLMKVDYAVVARGMPAAIRRATAILDGR